MKNSYLAPTPRGGGFFQECRVGLAPPIPLVPVKTGIVSDLGFRASNFTILDGIFLALPDNSHDNKKNRELLTLSR